VARSDELPNRHVYDPFRLSVELQKQLYSEVVARSEGPRAAVLAYRTRGPVANAPTGVFVYPSVILHRRGRRRVTHSHNGAQTESFAGDRLVSVFPAGWEVRAGYLEPCEGLIVALTPALLAEVARPLGVEAAFPQRAGFADEVLEGVCETLWRGNAGSVPVADSLARALAARVLECYAPARPLVPAWFRRAEKFVLEHLAGPLSVESVADAAGLSRAHFSRLFKRACGLSPHEFVLRRRVERAKELLLSDPQLALAEVAAEVGFCDQSHLTARFRELTGRTPAAYRSEGPHASPIE
jgi:AraC-like DNA-binding protein